MVEVFKTNVKDPGQAQRLIQRVENEFKNCRANFDLEDSDNILRVECNTGVIPVCTISELLLTLGFVAEVLPDEVRQELYLQSDLIDQ